MFTSSFVFLLMNPNSLIDFSTYFILCCYFSFQHSNHAPPYFDQIFPNFRCDSMFLNNEKPTAVFATDFHQLSALVDKFVVVAVALYPDSIAIVLVCYRYFSSHDSAIDVFITFYTNYLHESNF